MILALASCPLGHLTNRQSASVRKALLYSLDGLHPHRTTGFLGTSRPFLTRLALRSRTQTSRHFISPAFLTASGRHEKPYIFAPASLRTSFRQSRQNHDPL